MTSGSIFLNTGAYPGLGELYLRTWSGADGKNETFQGVRRDKWNAYTLNYFSESIQLGGSPGVSTTTGPLAQWTSSDDLQLQSKLVGAIKGHEFNLAVNLAQSRQLTDMVLLNVKKVGRSLLALKRGNFGQAARQLGISDHKASKLKAKDISGRWLEMQYGWLPSVSDTFEAFKAYNYITNMRHDRVAVKGQKILPFDGSAADTTYSSPGTSQARKKIVYEMYEDLSSPRGLGLLDPLSVAWEVLPWSFVIDWFIPIGSYLENLAILPFLKGRFLSTTVIKTAAAYLGPYDPIANPQLIGKKRVSHQVQVNRVVSTSLATQKPQFTNSLALSLSGKRIFNAAALAHQLLK